GDRGADARDHRVVAGDRPALVAHVEAFDADAHVAAQRIEHAHAVAALARGLDQAPRRVQLAVARKDGELHAVGPGWCRGGLPWSEDRAGSTVNAPAMAVRPSSIGNSMLRRSARLISMSRSIPASHSRVA